MIETFGMNVDLLSIRNLVPKIVPQIQPEPSKGKYCDAINTEA